ncbi:TPA: DNA cytosine methyltransferase [Escherichia coli]|jgi:DNA (cytosine-5)-methyltransferase 1|uniref:Cytosine-specific methyltransferase n=37 Tax=Enterobacteriaceae TaxID=543 RepID=G9BMK3_ECOLX|nr:MULTISPECIES: DNA cytosine methyltransferase [Enterobacteriaceae]EBX2142947.1 DNA cytosine methyltransferase [Salmonella enterica subsp. enterica serovar Kottbus]EFB3838521.1 DNA cytosine methyltransferase [Escherichia coli O103]EFX4853561.1 DNA cytosine methyltransferase [Shigella sonnei]AER93372.1 type II DNA methyltransferase M.EcoO34I [Escherichia coli]EAA2747040.1 DNA cytosine methyltransferase [Escherichia coli]
MRIIDLFSGCGGLSLGFLKGGFDVVGAYDFWDPAIECYRDNFSHPIKKLDLSNVDDVVRELKDIDFDMIIGGPPCQDFSHAGLRIEGARANLTRSFSEIIKRIKPKWFVMENVDRALRSGAYLEARGIFKESGYGLTEIVLDASKCGVPQKRKRLFVIGKLDVRDGFILNEVMCGISKDSMTVRNYLGDSLGIEYYYRHPRNYNRRAIFSIDEPAPTVRGVNRPIPDGYLGHAGDPVSISENVRPLTTFERARLQTFPEDFKFKGAKTNLEQMIGNAVPVELAKYVAVTIMEYEKKQVKGIYDKEGFRAWLLNEKKLTKRTSSDIISRCCRGVSFFDSEGVDFYNCEIDEIIMKLERLESFVRLGVSLKSQLRRAFKLYYEYCRR